MALSYLYFVFVWIVEQVKDFFGSTKKKSFEENAQEVTSFAVDYYERPEKYKVTTGSPPWTLFGKFESSAPETPVDFSRVMNFFKKHVVPELTHWHHPRFHAFFPAGRSYPDMLAELLISAIGPACFSYDSCPAAAEMEHVMVNWIGRAMGLPESFLFESVPGSSTGGGTFLESSSEANFCSILAARNWKLKEAQEEEHDACKKLVFYCSNEAHSSMKKGCRLAMVRCHSIETKEKNGWGLTGNELESRICLDLEKGLRPAFVLAVVGTTSNAASDHVLSIVRVAKKYELYVHVDAAYAGAFWFDPKYRLPREAVEGVNSISCSLHKALYHSCQSSVFFCRDRRLHCETFSISPVYLTPSNEETIDYRDWGIQLSRRFKALKSWFVLSHFGIEGIRKRVNSIVELAEYFIKQVEKHPNCRISGGRNLGVFCFQYVEPGLSEEEINQETTRFCRFMNSSHEVFFTHTRIGEKNLVRVSINYDRATNETVEDTWTVVQELISKFKETRRKDGERENLLVDVSE